jgi:hypothetical protein
MPVAALRAAHDRAHWEVPGRNLAVGVRMAGDTLDVHFLSRSVGELTWPILPPQDAVKAYILPMHEGVYVPTGDAGWRDYLAHRHGLSTTGDLSLPLWGLDCGTRTLTYILTNPFDNEMAFRTVGLGRGIEARLTHSFTRPWKVREYGVRISIGPANPIEPALRYRNWLVSTGHFVAMREKMTRVPEARKLLGAMHAYLWGDGISLQMLDALHAGGVDRCWLGADGWERLQAHPEVIRRAKALGYLIAPYDSYDSVHSPDAGPDDTWETAQFDRALYETGAIVGPDGRKRPGFQHKGYMLSPLVAQPYVERRVSGLRRTLASNSWFIDCDAFGELFDDYSPQHPASQADDVAARLRRMAWMRDTFGLVIGSEGGAT